MAVKHTPTEKIHKGKKGGKTGCGFDTTENLDHWVDTLGSVTCKKDGCNN